MSEQVGTILIAAEEMDQPLELGALSHGRQIQLETYTRRKPSARTIMQISSPGEEPWVDMTVEHGNKVSGGTIKLIGSCTLEAWQLRRIHDIPDETHRGLIVPGEHLVMALPKLFVPAWSVKGWQVHRVKTPNSKKYDGSR